MPNHRNEIAQYKQQIAEYQHEIEVLQYDKELLQHEIRTLRDSNSWKITAPYRWIGTKIHSIRFGVKVIADFVTIHGGGWRGWGFFFVRIWKKLQQHGLKGLVTNWITYYSYHQRDSESYRVKRKRITHFPLVRHTIAVDIIICVHNALEDVKKCLDSVIRHTYPPYQLLLVDDGSDTETRDFLHHFAAINNARLIRNEFAHGYTLAANQGIRASQAPYVVLLNSDTIVCSNWLDRMIICAESDPDLGMVGPLSNTASWQSIPAIEQNGDWSNNPLPKVMTIEEMSQLVALYSGQLYPRIPFLNGFCLLIKRVLIDEIGYFDEENFARGYGEENDFCLRAKQAGWLLAVADDVYIYHAQSRSYSSEQRQQLCEVASQVLAQKHGQTIIDEGVYICRHNRAMIGNRIRAERIFERYELIKKAKSLWREKRVIFILPIRDAGGGANVVISEILALIRMGVDVWLLNFGYLKSNFERSYPEINIPVIYAQNTESIPELCVTFDAVIATHNSSVAWIAPLINMTTASPILGYYIQDFEPYFYQKGSAEYQSAIASYTLIPEIVCITKTQWNKQKVLDETGVDCALLGPSVDIDLYRPRTRSDLSWPNRPIRICAMIRPSSPRRNPLLTMQVLKFIEKKYKDKIEIILFGEESNSPDFIELPRDFNWRNLGKQTREEVALLLNEVDVFVDFSSYQAMGLTAMEAMACGVAVILPENGGASSFACHEKNALFVDTKDQSLCQLALDRLISDHALRMRLQQQSQIDVTQFFSEKAAFNLLEALFSTQC